MPGASLQGERCRGHAPAPVPTLPVSPRSSVSHSLSGGPARHAFPSLTAGWAALTSPEKEEHPSCPGCGEGAARPVEVSSCRRNPKCKASTAGGRIFVLRRHHMTTGHFRLRTKMWLACGALWAWALPLARPPRARACGGGGGISYTQGQSPEPRTREYFYYVDHQGQVGWGRGRGGPLQ